MVAALCALLLPPQIFAQTQNLLPLGATWRYYKGTTEASTPTSAWRAPDFADGAWLSGPAPFRYNVGSGGTVLSDMRNGYTTVFLRTTFNVARAADVERLSIRTHIDDGFAIWINGVEGPRFNVADGEPARQWTAAGTINLTWVTNAVDAAPFLRDGVNVIAVQLFNSTLTSSDIHLNMAIDSVTDRIAPTIVSVNPTPGSVEELRSITVNFSEPVSGVAATDFLVNNVPATSVSGTGATYTFAFPQPAFGPVDIRWEEGHQITDLATPPNAFVSTGWSYDLNDRTPPTVVSINPPASSTVRSLSQIEVRFSEEVRGVDVGALLINNSPATTMTVNGNAYRFFFPTQPEGAVNVAWVANHSIADIAGNPFVAGSFSYTVDPNYAPPTVVISEFLAQNSTGLVDEDNEFQDWIEIHNVSASPVNLEGWSLTDDPEDPDLWIFPNVTLAAGARIVVFASEKNRTPAAGNLHTNFKLGASGEYLALFNTESPQRAVSVINYPEQRTDHSYGLDANGAWAYFLTPTPRASNGSTSILGLIPPLGPNVRRGTFDAPFALEITNAMAGVTIRYTTDFSEPTAINGQTYTGPIQISTTTVLRAAAFRANYLPSEIFTGSYIFLDQVLTQPNNPAGFPVGPTVFTGYPSDYEMDPEIVNDANYGPQMKPALKALPVMSICIKMDDMFGPVNGIYTHPLNRGPTWEKPCSLEFIKQDGGGFQIDAGLQMQGNAAREPIKNPKHPMRVVFKRDYGPPNLRYQMFPDSPLEYFDTLILRADFNYGWLHWNPTQRIRAQRTRDSWMKDSMRAMGGLASHNRYVHLFINGLYWGIYDPAERPDGAFGAGYLGGQKEDYDVMNEGAVVDGSITAYNTMINHIGLADIARYNTMKTYLDMKQFIDYMLLHFYVGHEDWFRNKNWYAIRPKNGSRGFLYLPWDGEMMLGEPSINRVTLQDLPSGLHTNLMTSAEYKLEFADRVHKHFFNDGALTPAKNIERWMNRARQVELPIVAESARWGDYRRDVHQYQAAPYELYTRDVQWRAEQRRLTNSYFPSRTTTVLNQLKAVGLYPNVSAPVFNRQGGSISPGFELTMSGAGTIYYTTDGTDPRVYGTGAVSASARTYSSAMTLNSSTIVKARILSGNVWSALNEALFSTDAFRTPLRFTEIMYNPDPPGDAYEYVEIQNVSALPVDVTGCYIDRIDYIFPPLTTLQPGQIVLLASGRNPTGWAARYPTAPQPFGYFAGQLSNSGERIAISNPDGRTITSVEFDDEAGWPQEADGRGYSIQVNDPFGDPSAAANWRISNIPKGTPGVANPGLPPVPIAFSEIYASSDDNTDYLELVSTHGTDVDLTGWTVWKTGNPARFTFPEGSTIIAGGHIVVMADRLTNSPGLHAPWGLDRDGDTLILSDRLGRRMDAATLGSHARGFSIGKVEGAWRLTEKSPNAPNVAAPTATPSQLVINEWLANPVAGEADWLELHNPAESGVVALHSLYFATEFDFFEMIRPSYVGPGEFVRLYANESSGGLDFKIPAEGGDLDIYNPAGARIHSVDYEARPEGVSEGRYPDASANIISFPFATPAASNTLEFPLAFTIEAAALRLTWPSLVGAAFQVQAASELLPQTQWNSIGTVQAQNTAPTFDAPIELTGARFYRVVRTP